MLGVPPPSATSLCIDRSSTDGVRVGCEAVDHKSTRLLSLVLEPNGFGGACGAAKLARSFITGAVHSVVERDAPLAKLDDSHAGVAVIEMPKLCDRYRRTNTPYGLSPGP